MKKFALIGASGALGLVMVVAALFGGAVPQVAAASSGPLTAEVVGAYAYRAGFRGAGLVTAIAVAQAESGFDPANVGTNPPTKSCPNGSRDRGLWQINDCAHPDVSDACAFDPACNAAAAFTISGGGTVWSPWVAFTTGRHLPFMAAAQAAALVAPSIVLPIAVIVGNNALPLPHHLLSDANVLVPHHNYPAWDAPVPTGTPVFAIEGGTATLSSPGGDCGNGVIIAAAGHTDTYCHGSAVAVTAGQVVRTGQRIMSSGSTGESTGPHLHLQIDVQGHLVCPQPMLYSWLHGVPFAPTRATSTGCAR